MTVILSQQYWQMKANTDQHNTIQNTLATVFKRENSCCHLVSNWKQNGKKTKSVKSWDEIRNKKWVRKKWQIKIEIAKHYDIPKSTLSGILNKTTNSCSSLTCTNFG